MAPVVGITTSLSEAGDSQSAPVAYANAVADAGGTPLLLPMLKDPSYRASVQAHVRTRAGRNLR